MYGRQSFFGEGVGTRVGMVGLGADPEEEAAAAEGQQYAGAAAAVKTPAPDTVTNVLSALGKVGIAVAGASIAAKVKQKTGVTVPVPGAAKKSGLPTWVVPVSIAAGVGLLAVLVVPRFMGGGKKG